MKKPFLEKSYLLPLLLFLSLSFFSCSSQKKVKYFQDIPDSGLLKAIPTASYTEPIIQVDDILSINIQTIDPLATSMLSVSGLATPSYATTTTALSPLPQATAPATGYLVNKEGLVQIPILGYIKLGGLTTSQAIAAVKSVAAKYFKDPTVTVRYANFKVSVTGEVARPGQYILPNEKVTVYDALAMAGDLTIFGKRENVLLIRENPDGTKMPYRINLKKSDFLSSSYYYLRQNDIIYVEPRKAKSDATDAAQSKYISIAGSILSIILVLATRRL